MYFVFQGFGTITSFSPKLHLPLVSPLQSQSRVVFSMCSGLPAGFLRNLKQLDKLCDLHYHPLENLWLIFQNGPGIWGSLVSQWPGFRGFSGGRSKTSEQPEHVKWWLTVLGSSTAICSWKPSLYIFFQKLYTAFILQSSWKANRHSHFIPPPTTGKSTARWVYLNSICLDLLKWIHLNSFVAFRGEGSDALRGEAMSVLVYINGSLREQTSSHHVTISGLLVYTEFSLSDAKIYTRGFSKMSFSLWTAIYLCFFGLRWRIKYIFPFKANTGEKYASISM